MPQFSEDELTALRCAAAFTLDATQATPEVLDDEEGDGTPNADALRSAYNKLLAVS